MQINEKYLFLDNVLLLPLNSVATQYRSTVMGVITCLRAGRLVNRGSISSSGKLFIFFPETYRQVLRPNSLLFSGVYNYLLRWKDCQTPTTAMSLLTIPLSPSTGHMRWVNPYPTAFPNRNGMVLHFYQQQESSTTKTVHKVINKGLKTYV